MNNLWQSLKARARRRLECLVVWLDTPPDDGDLFGVHIRETWQAFRRNPDNAGAVAPSLDADVGEPR